MVQHLERVEVRIIGNPFARRRLGKLKVQIKVDGGAGPFVIVEAAQATAVFVVRAATTAAVQATAAAVPNTSKTASITAAAANSTAATA